MARKKLPFKDSLLETLIDNAKDLRSIKTNLTNGTLIVDKTMYFVENHKKIYSLTAMNKEDLSEFDIEDCIGEPWSVVEKLYELYKRSVPDKEMKYTYFKALSKEELTDYDLVFGLERYVIKSILEGYVCLAIASGILKWEDETKWFWQSKNDPDLIVLKKWFVQ